MVKLRITFLTFCLQAACSQGLTDAASSAKKSTENNKAENEQGSTNDEKTEEDNQTPDEGDTNQNESEKTGGTDETATTDPTGESTVPSDDSGETQAITLDHHILFATSESFNGNLGGIAGADDTCTQLAKAASLPDVVWKAILSDGVNSAKDRLTLNKPIHNVKGDVLVGAGAFSWVKLEKQMTYNEKGLAIETTGDPVIVQSHVYAWTGTTTTGTSSPLVRTCSGWTSADAANKGDAGWTFSSTDFHWINGAFAYPCNLARALYCVSL